MKPPIQILDDQADHFFSLYYPIWHFCALNDEALYIALEHCDACGRPQRRQDLFNYIYCGDYEATPDSGVMFNLCHECNEIKNQRGQKMVECGEYIDDFKRRGEMVIDPDAYFNDADTLSVVRAFGDVFLE